ncbi:MAG: 50S ribosomal protein L22 [Bacteroidales bacterium]|jgi:large subunit ribosomal protein L22|nr:50S ribosomal protein L22 [Bacteroidales bacterium]MDD4217258.1 50S ribosomal protein L22 [Bacteroidales bacterium]MDY0141290.1 50S ribosomal protein L22 [Bacteroidales bacterium]
MGARKRIVAEKRKEDKKKRSFAILRDCPSSPRKMRLVADQVRGVEVDKALDILKYSPKVAARDIEKLLLSAVSNWQGKNENQRMEDANLYVKEIFVDSARALKRIKPAPQGRAYRIKKRSNHVTLVVDSKLENQVVNENA